MLQLIRKKRVDIIHPFLTPATLFTLLPAVINRTPVKIVTERGSLRQNLGRGYKLYLRIEDFLTRFADLVIPNSASGQNHLVNRGINPSNIRVIYNGINIPRLIPKPDDVFRKKTDLGLSDNGCVVGISASLFSLKDHATFLRAARIVCGVIPQVKYIILGDGPLRENLEEMTRELGIASSVYFLGNQTEVSPYLSLFDIACLCSKEPEGCSNSILEAMALGKPVVATALGGNVELVDDGKTGLLVAAQNPELLAEAFLTLINDPQKAKEMGERGKDKINRVFSFERMIADYGELYEEAMKVKGFL